MNELIYYIFKVLQGSTILLSFVFCPLFSASSEVPEYEFKEVKIKHFLLKVPNKWQDKKSRNLSIIYFSGPKNAVYPSINVLKVPGEYDFQRPINTQLQEIVSSYQKSGFINVRPSSPSLWESDFGPLFTSKITYSVRELDRVSEIFIVSGSQEHYIGTLTRDVVAAEPLELKDFLSSFTPKAQQKHSPPLVSLLLLLLLAFVLVLIWKFRPKKRLSGDIN